MEMPAFAALSLICGSILHGESTINTSAYRRFLDVHSVGSIEIQVPKGWNKLKLQNPPFKSLEISKESKTTRCTFDVKVFEKPAGGGNISADQLKLEFERFYNLHLGVALHDSSNLISHSTGKLKLLNQQGYVFDLLKIRRGEYTQTRSFGFLYRGNRYSLTQEARWKKGTNAAGQFDKTWREQVTHLHLR